MNKTFYAFLYRLESTTTELEFLTETAANDANDMSSPTTNHQLDAITETPMIRKPPSSLLKGRLGFASSTPSIVGDRLKRLKQEFNRCVADLKAKRHEIVLLNEQIKTKNQQIEQIKADENRVLIENSLNKEKLDRLTNRLQSLEWELKESKRNNEFHAKFNTIQDENHKNIDELFNQNKKLETENENFRKNCDHLNETIKELEDERDKIEEKYRAACLDISELQRKLTDLASNSCLSCEKEKSLAESAQQECNRIKELYIRLHDEKEEITQKLKENDFKLMEYQSTIGNLKKSFELTESKCMELTESLERERSEKSSNESKEQKDCANKCRKCNELTKKISKVSLNKNPNFSIA